MKYGEVLVEYTTQYLNEGFTFNGFIFCFTEFSEIMKRRFKRKKLTVKAFDCSKGGRIKVGIGKAERYCEPFGFDFYVQDKNTGYLIFEDELEALGIEPEEDIYFWLEFKQ